MIVYFNKNDFLVVDNKQYIKPAYCFNNEEEMQSFFVSKGSLIMEYKQQKVDPSFEYHLQNDPEQARLLDEAFYKFKQDIWNAPGDTVNRLDFHEHFIKKITGQLPQGKKFFLLNDEVLCLDERQELMPFDEFQKDAIMQIQYASILVKYKEKQVSMPAEFLLEQLNNQATKALNLDFIVLELGYNTSAIKNVVSVVGVPHLIINEISYKINALTLNIHQAINKIQLATTKSEINAIFAEYNIGNLSIDLEEEIDMLEKRLEAEDFVSLGYEQYYVNKAKEFYLQRK